MAEDRKTFFKRITIPINANWQENGAEFVNPIVVADMFAEATGIAASLAMEAEELTDDVAGLDRLLAQQERRLDDLRRDIIKSHIASVKASWGTEMLDAFVLKKAEEDQKQTTLLEYEADIAETKDQRSETRAALLSIQQRLRTLEKNMEWAEQYLNFDKLMQRILGGGRPH